MPRPHTRATRASALWSEPLTVDVIDTNEHRYDVRIREGTGALVAALRIEYSLRARSAACGELRVLDATGGPKQKRRALVLLLREALHHAQDLGLQQGCALVLPALTDIAERISGQRAQVHRSD